MLRSWTRGLLFWLAFYEALAARRGWRGLSWLGAAPRWPLLGLALAGLPRPAPRHLAAMALAGLPALALQATAASLRNPALNPLLRLAPGTHPGYRVERLDLPLDDGHIPALHLTPHGGTQRAVVILHGSGCDKTYFAWRLADMLLARGIAALLIDLDGHGESPRWQRFPEILEDAVESVGWLRQRYARVGMLGVSLGGCIAARAVAAGLVVDALALLEAPPYLAFGPAEIRREALALSEPFLLDLLREATPGFLAYTIYDLVRVQSGPRIRCTIGTVDLIAALDLPDALPQIAAPLLLVYGARDAIVRPDQAELVRRAAPLHARFHMISGASHLSLTLAPQTLQLTGDWLGARL